MISKKIMISITTAVILTTLSSTYGVYEAKALTKDNNSVVLDYKNLSSKTSNSIAVTNIDNLQFVDWLDDNHIVHLKKVYTDPKGEFWNDRYVLNSYDIKNKIDTLISPKDTKMSTSYNFSPSRNRIFIDTYGSAESNKKIIDLKDNKVIDLKEKDADVSYTWISDDIIFKNYMLADHWTIEDLNGNILYKGKIKESKLHEYGSIIIGTDLKKVGDKIEGKVYYEESIYEKGSKFPKTLKSIIYERDINTQKERKLFERDGYANIDINKGKIYELSFRNKNINTQPTFKTLDCNGNTVKEYVLTQDIMSSGIASFSPDGKYAACILKKLTPSEKRHLEGTNLICILNLETGEITKAFERYGNINGVNDLMWSPSSKSFGFYYEDDKRLITTYVVDVK